jgi:hypothetical protein
MTGEQLCFVLCTLTPQYILNVELPGLRELSKNKFGTGRTHLITAADKGSASNVQESQVLRDFLPVIEFCRLDVPINFHMFLGRPHVLSKGNDIDIDFTKLCKLHSEKGNTKQAKCTFKSMQNLLFRLTEAKHYAGFGDSHTFLLRVLENLETLSEGSAAVAHVGCQLLDRFDIVRINIEPGLSHDGDVFERTPEIPGESFDQYVRCPVRNKSLGEKKN